MNDNASYPNPPAPSSSELELLERLRLNPQLKAYVEEIASLAHDPAMLAGTAEQAELRALALSRGVGKAGLQGWAQAANESCEAEIDRRPARPRRHGKKNSAG